MTKSLKPRAKIKELLQFCDRMWQWLSLCRKLWKQKINTVTLQDLLFIDFIIHHVSALQFHLKLHSAIIIFHFNITYSKIIFKFLLWRMISKVRSPPRRPNPNTAIFIMVSRNFCSCNQYFVPEPIFWKKIRPQIIGWVTLRIQIITSFERYTFPDFTITRCTVLAPGEPMTS